MKKINFTREHEQKMLTLAITMLMENESITTKLGQPVNVVDLMHNTTINSLNSMRISLSKKVETLENEDEWAASQNSQAILEVTKRHKELVNLIIGYKRNLVYKEELRLKRAQITEELNTLKESQKTPEDKIKELEEELANLE